MSDLRKASILHVDLDAFFVSMELLRRPELRGKPVVVAGGLGPRGVVNTCSYEARAFGVRAAMPMSRARQLCPHATFLESDYPYYSEASRQFHAILRDYTPLVEPAGADEAYLDVGGSERLFGEPETIARDLRRRIVAEIGITGSVGVSINKLVSKVASDAGKPDGLVLVRPGEEAAFLAPRPIRELPMVGPKTAATLAALGVHSIGDLAAVPLSVLESRFGRHGAELHSRARGVYEAPVLAGRGEAKSISRENTFGEDEPDGLRLRGVLLGQAERVAADLERERRAARTITLKLRFPPFETVTRSVTSARPFHLATELFEAGAALFEKVWADNGKRPVRLIGLGATNLQEQAQQLRLGETREADHLATAVSALRERFGEGVIGRAAEIRHHRGIPNRD